MYCKAIVSHKFIILYIYITYLYINIVSLSVYVVLISCLECVDNNNMTE